MRILLLVDFHPSYTEHIEEERSGPGAIHDGAIQPIDARNFLELGTHGVASVARALESAYHGMLWKRSEVIYREGNRLVHEAIYADTVGRCVEMWDWAVIAVVGLAMVCYEAITGSR